MFKTLIFFLLLCSGVVEAKTVRYELTATNTPVNITGREVNFAILLNGQLPAPTLEFTEGDDAEIIVKNNVPNQELSIHWHGILLPPEMDGVSYVNTPPIRSGQSHTFKFRIRQSGTYWYHSHTGVQEQKGVYGGIIIHPRKETLQYDKDVVVVLSDWSDENADQILRNLRKDGDYYLQKKGTVRSWYGAIRAGSLGNMLYNEWTRMGGMDLSDVGYDAFLINGKISSQLAELKKNQRVRLRLINAAASSYFYVSLGDNLMNVVSADGMNIMPMKAKDLLIGMAETYDLIFTVPDNRNYELRATCQDGTGFTSGWIGSPNGSKVFAPDRPRPDLYAKMDHKAHEGHMNHGGGGHEGHSAQVNGAVSGEEHHGSTSSSESAPDANAHFHGGSEAAGAPDKKSKDHFHDGSKPEQKNSHPTHQMKHEVESLSVDDLMSPIKMQPFTKPTYDVKLVLGGDMNRYIWYINDKAIHQDRNIVINEGDVVRFTFKNSTMMHHPMHLHGHFFRVLTHHGDFSPLKHTVDVPPHGTRTIEFTANEPGEWMLHCHNLYHMKNGMARVVKYSSFTPSKEIADWQSRDPHLHDHLYYTGMVEAATNHAQAKLRLTKTWDEVEARFETREDYSYEEADLFYRRWFTPYFNIIAGGTDVHRQTHGIAGIGWILPMLIHSKFLLNHEGEYRIDLEKEFQWTRFIYSDVDVSWRQNQKTEFEVSLMYSSDWHWSAGFKFTEKDAGVGLQIKF